MEVREQVSPIVVAGAVVLLLALAVAGVCAWSGAFSLHAGSTPGQVAEAQVVSQVSAMATATAVAHLDTQARIQDQEAEHNAALAAVESSKASALRQQVYEVMAAGISLVAAAGALYLAILMLSDAVARMRRAVLPVTRQISAHLLIYWTPGGPMLVDTLTGLRARLNDREGIQAIKARLETEIEIARIESQAAKALPEIIANPRQAEQSEPLARAPMFKVNSTIEEP